MSKLVWGIILIGLVLTTDVNVLKTVLVAIICLVIFLG